MTQSNELLDRMESRENQFISIINESSEQNRSTQQSLFALVETLSRNLFNSTNTNGTQNTNQATNLVSNNRIIQQLRAVGARLSSAPTIANNINNTITATSTTDAIPLSIEDAQVTQIAQNTHALVQSTATTLQANGGVLNVKSPTHYIWMHE